MTGGCEMLYALLPIKRKKKYIKKKEKEGSFPHKGEYPGRKKRPGRILRIQTSLIVMPHTWSMSFRFTVNSL